MASEPSYNAFIAQLERKHQVEPPGHDSYVDVFNQAARLIGHLKKGINYSIKREKQSEIRVAAQSWQDSAYNDHPGGGIDILDWQPRFAKLDQPDGPTTHTTTTASATLTDARASKSAATHTGVAYPGTPTTRSRRRSNSSPQARQSLPARRTPDPTAPPHAPLQPRPPPLGPGTGTGSASAAPQGSGEAPPASGRSVWARPQPIVPPSGSSPRAAAGDASGGGGSGGDSGGRNPTGARTPTGAAAGSGLGVERRRASDHSLAHPSVREGERPRAASGTGWRREDGAGGRRRGFGAGGVDETTIAVRERSFTYGSQPSRLPPLEESPSVSQSGISPQQQQQQQQQQQGPARAARSGSLADQAIRLFAQTAYEPGEHRQSLLTPALLGGGTSTDGSGPSGDHHGAHRAGPLPLAPVPRAVPRHVTEAASAMSYSGLSPTGSEGPSRRGFGDTSPSAARGASSPTGAALPYPDALRQPSWQSPPSFLQPRPPGEPPTGSSQNLRPAALRGRLGPTSSSAPSATSPSGMDVAAAAAAAAAGGPVCDAPLRQVTSLSSEADSSPLRVPRAGRRSSVAEYLGADSPVRVRAPSLTAVGGGDRGSDFSPSGRTRHSVSGLPGTLGPPAVRGSKELGGNVTAPPPPIAGRRASLSGDAAAAAAASGGGGGPNGGGAGGGGGGGGLIRGYVGGGWLDHRMLDMVPRLGLDAPRVRPQEAAGSGPGPAGSGPGLAPGAMPSPRRGPAGSPGAEQDAQAELRRGLQAAPAGLEGDSRSPRPVSLADDGAGGASPGRFARARRNSCCSGSAAPMAPMAVARSGASVTMGAGVGLGGMMVTREQVDSYVQTQSPVLARPVAATAGGGGQRGVGVVNVIGMRGCLAEEPASPSVVRALRREMASTDLGAKGMRGL